MTPTKSLALLALVAGAHAFAPLTTTTTSTALNQGARPDMHKVFDDRDIMAHAEDYRQVANTNKGVNKMGLPDTHGVFDWYSDEKRTGQLGGKGFVAPPGRDVVTEPTISATTVTPKTRDLERTVNEPTIKA